MAILGDLLYIGIMILCVSALGFIVVFDSYGQRAPLDSDNDRIPDSSDKCPREPENYNGFEDSDGCPDDPRGTPTVKLFAEQKGRSILLSWYAELELVERIAYTFQILRSEDLEMPRILFDSSRSLDEKLRATSGFERFHYLDERVSFGHNYTYQIIIENPNDGKKTVSPRSNTVELFDFVKPTEVTAKGYLIEGRTLRPVPIMPSAFAENFTTPVFTTTINPLDESYRLALEPIPRPIGSGDCSQLLEFEYSRNLAKGQDFTVVTSVFETEQVTDDNTGVEITTEVKTLRYQKTYTKFTDSDTIKQKFLHIAPEDQTIYNFTALEVQFDVSGNSTLNPFEHRSLSVWDLFFTVPSDNSVC